VAVVPESNAEGVLAAMRRHAYGRSATLVGRVTEEHPGRVVIKNPFGVKRVIEILASDQFPRIC
jgi:hydrogenase expression/formation protein HypE